MNLLQISKVLRNRRSLATNGCRLVVGKRNSKPRIITNHKNTKNMSKLKTETQLPQTLLVVGRVVKD
jgi:hypothetical protein